MQPLIVWTLSTYGFQQRPVYSLQDFAHQPAVFTGFDKSSLQQTFKAGRNTHRLSDYVACYLSADSDCLALQYFAHLLAVIIGFDKVSLQPNSGAGEYAGLLAIW